MRILLSNSVIPDALQREALLRWSGISCEPLTDPGTAPAPNGAKL